MTFHLQPQPDGSFHVYDASNEFILGIVQETPFGPYFIPYQGPEVMCWVPQALRELADLLEGWEAAKAGLEGAPQARN